VWVGKLVDFLKGYERVLLVKYFQGISCLDFFGEETTMNIINLEAKKTLLIKNTFMLYVLNFSIYFFGFITIPYQTRVLGPEYFGKLGFAFALMMYFQLLIDFGFILSATEDVSKNSSNKEELSRIVISVTIVKVILTIFSLLLLTTLCLFIPMFRADSKFYIICFLGVAVNSFIPDYLYRGLEKMNLITGRTVIIKLFFTIMVFLFLKNREDYYLVPILNLIGNTLALIFVYIHITRSLGIKAINVKRRYICGIIKRSSGFFYSRIASTVYGATNTFLLGIIYPTGSNVIGFYSSSDKLVNTAKSLFSPILKVPLGS